MYFVLSKETLSSSILFLDILISIILVIEISLKIAFLGRHFWHNLGNILDFFVVLLCILTLLIIFFDEKPKKTTSSYENNTENNNNNDSNHNNNNNYNNSLHRQWEERITFSFFVIFRNIFQFIRLFFLIKNCSENIQYNAIEEENIFDDEKELFNINTNVVSPQKITPVIYIF